MGNHPCIVKGTFRRASLVCTLYWTWSLSPSVSPTSPNASKVVVTASVLLAAAFAFIAFMVYKWVGWHTLPWVHHPHTRALLYRYWDQTTYFNGFNGAIRIMIMGQHTHYPFLHLSIKSMCSHNTECTVIPLKRYMHLFFEIRWGCSEVVWIPSERHWVRLPDVRSLCSTLSKRARLLGPAAPIDRRVPKPAGCVDEWVHYMTEH